MKAKQGYGYPVNDRNRAMQSEATFDDAAKLATENGMRLTNPSMGCFQLRHKKNGWILNLYPRRNGQNPRAFHDPKHRGPFLELPEAWTLLDAVNAASTAWNEGQR